MKNKQFTWTDNNWTMKDLRFQRALARERQSIEDSIDICIFKMILAVPSIGLFTQTQQPIHTYRSSFVHHSHVMFAWRQNHLNGGEVMIIEQKSSNKKYIARSITLNSHPSFPDIRHIIALKISFHHTYGSVSLPRSEMSSDMNNRHMKNEGEIKTNMREYIVWVDPWAVRLVSVRLCEYIVVYAMTTFWFGFTQCNSLKSIQY